MHRLEHLRTFGDKSCIFELTVSAQTGALAMDSGGSSAMRMQSQPYLSLLPRPRGFVTTRDVSAKKVAHEFPSPSASHFRLGPPLTYFYMILTEEKTKLHDFQLLKLISSTAVSTAVR